MNAAACRQARALAVVLRRDLRAAGFTVLRANQDGDLDEVAVWVLPNDIVDGRVEVLVIGTSRQTRERRRAYEVLSARHRVRFDTLASTLTVHA